MTAREHELERLLRRYRAQHDAMKRNVCDDCPKECAHECLCPLCAEVRAFLAPAPPEERRFTIQEVEAAFYRWAFVVVVSAPDSSRWEDFRAELLKGET